MLYICILAILCMVGIAGLYWYIKNTTDQLKQLIATSVVKIVNATLSVPVAEAVPPEGQARCNKCGLFVVRYVKKANGVIICTNCQKGSY